MCAGSIDVGWLPGGTYAIYSQAKEVDVILTATRAGLSNDSTDPATWNGEANKTLPTEEQVTFYRSLIYAAPTEKGKALAAKANAGEKLTWEELNDATWAVGNTSSSAGYIYPTMWLMANYDGKKVSDLQNVVQLGYADAFAQAAAEQVDVILTATRAGLSNDSTDPATWNGEANKTLPTDEQVTFYRSLIYAAPTEKGKALAAKVNAGEKLTWEELNDATWVVGNTSSSAGYIYPTMWLMENYEGKKVSDLANVVQLGYADAFAQAAAEQVDVIVCYADGRRDYEAAWNTATDSADATGKAGMGRTESIWNELNVIGVTEGIYNDTVAITTANADVYNPEFINALQTALINIINTEEGQAIFSVYSHTGYAIATDADYNGARTALTAVQ